MQRVKLFKSVESEISNLEHEVNHWLTETGARIISVNGNIAPQSLPLHPATSEPSISVSYGPSDVLLVVLYELPAARADNV